MIEIEGVTKRYGRVLAVDDVTVTVPAGVVTGFLGPNGAGRSTTMRLIAGLDAPTSGRVRIDGRDYRRSPAPMTSWGCCWRPGPCIRAGPMSALRPAAAAGGPGSAVGQVGGPRWAVTQAGVLRSQWTKLRSLRSTLWTLLAAVGLMVGIGVLLASVSVEQYADLADARARTTSTRPRSA